MTEAEGAIRELWMRVQMQDEEIRRLRAQVAEALQATKLGSGAGFGGDAGLIPILLPTGIAAGSVASPATASDAVKLLPSGSSGALTSSGAPGEAVISTYTTAISGTNKFAWATRNLGFLRLVVADC